MRQVRHWIRPESPQQAVEQHRSRGASAAYLGGGTRLALLDDPGLETLIDLAHLKLDQIEASPAGLHVGATTPLESLRRHAALPQLGDGILTAALTRTRIEAWRNQATLAGQLRDPALSPLLCTVLLALDARVEALRDPAVPPEHLSLEEAFRLDPSDLILSVQIPSSVGWRHGLESVGHSAHDVPLCSVSAGVLLVDGRVRAARVGRSSSSTAPMRLHRVEAALSGAMADGDLLQRGLEALDEETPDRADDRAGGEYRAHLGQVLLARVIRCVLEGREAHC